MPTISDPGVFWRSDEPDKKMHGRLTFDEAGGRVELSGDLGGIDAFEARNLKRYRRLIGESQNLIYTLDGCRLRRGSTGSANGMISNLELRVQTIIVDAEFNTNNDLLFDSIEVHPIFLERWAPADWLGEEHYWRDQETRGHVQLTAKKIEPEIAQITDSLHLTIGSSIRISGDRYSTCTLHGDRYFCVKSDRLLSLSELIDLANDFQDLVSIATGRIAAFDKT